MTGTLRVDHLVPVYEGVEFSAHASMLRMAQSRAVEHATWEAIVAKGGAEQYDRVVVRHQVGRGQPVSLIRNEIVRGVLRAAEHDPHRTDEEHVLLWQDSDVVVDVEHAAELLALLALSRENVGAIAAVVPVQDERDGPLRPNVSLEYPPTTSRIDAPEISTTPAELLAALEGQDRSSAPLEVYRVGLAFVAVRAAAYLTTPRPWHRFEHDPPELSGVAGLEKADDVLGEDLGWCDLLRSHGWSVWVAPHVRADHVVRRRLTWPRWQREDAAATENAR